MKQATRIINSVLVAIVASSVCIYSLVQNNSANYRVHPVVTLICSILPGIIAGFAFYWWNARRKQKKLLSITPKEAASLAIDNIDDQHTDKINGFLRDASARSIQEYIHTIPISAQKAYAPNAIIALNIRIAENAEITTRRIVCLTWALVLLSVALLVFSIWQTLIIKKDIDTHSHQIQLSKNHEEVQAASLLPSVQSAPPVVQPSDLSNLPQAIQNSAWDDLLKLHPEWAPKNSNSTSAFPRN